MPLSSATGQSIPAPSRVVPEAIAPPLPEIGRDTIDPRRADIVGLPGRADDLSVTLSSIHVAGLRPRYRKQVDALVAPLVDVRVKVSRLYALAGEIEAIFARDGHILTRVVVPPQALADGGDLRLEIVEGFIEGIDTGGLPRRVRGAVSAPLTRLVKRPGITLPEIERQLLLAGRAAGVTLRSALVAGQEAGGTRLVLEAGWKPVSGTVTIDNRPGDVYDNAKIDGLVAINGVLGTGERIYGYLSTAPDLALTSASPLRRIFGAGFDMPIGGGGLVFHVDGITADINPRTPANVARLIGTFERFGAGLRYPVVLRRREQLDVDLSLEAVREIQTLPQFATDLSRDRLRTVSLAVNWRRSRGAATQAGLRIGLAQGLDALGARTVDASASGIPLSRLGARPDYTALRAESELSSPLGRGFRGSLFLRTQISASGPLPAAAQFSLDAQDAVAGYSLGALNVDEGTTVRGELARTVLQERSFAVSPYLLAAYGHGRLKR
ncbi:ShlB/FhaC/HecB family hemolysin secretion/activation protein [Croceicoccus sp. YJ47]|uniref:ShlB/FhaC/HecB family hemolysin secretion/activation protein n=1 Tax=Croceicoccus sp. YJ47 TaxID=2798724 RepID=UPI0019218191|nr:ShlB/FhaC/HecB family hemolysin secretion/activation protein [Croceicoccus sp. YJ47]QQN74291.1 ShlB/FhaC/HecB family hemolysin secretion/activation protein [Croceicoccus sp. YJ47]